MQIERVIVPVIDHSHIFRRCLSQRLGERCSWLCVASYGETGGSTLLGSTTSLLDACAWIPTAISLNATA